VRLDPVVKEFYLEKGAALQKGAFAASELEIVARGISKNLANPSKSCYRRFEGEDGKGAFEYDYGCHSWVPEYAEFIESSGLAEAAAELLSSQRVSFFDDGYFVKQAGCTVLAPWHQDFSYYQIDRDFVVAWVPLDPCGGEQTLRLVAGSHRWEKEFPPVNFDPVYSAATGGAAFESPLAIPDVESGRCEVLAWAMDPGDCVFFSGRTLHGSRGNRTRCDQRRFTCRFIDAGASYEPRGAGAPGVEVVGVGIENATLRPGQCVSDDAENFPVIWQADATRS